MLKRIANRRLRIAFFAAILVLGLFGTLWAMGAFSQRSAHNSVVAAAPGQSADLVRVTTIRPKKDASFGVAIQQLAWVKPYFEASLKTRVAGVVRTVNADIGDAVTKGAILAEIDVPDLIQEVELKKSTIDQRRQELRVSQAKTVAAEALVDIGKAAVTQQQAAAAQAQASRDYRKKRLDRFRELFKRQAINEDLVDEQDKEWQAGEAAWQVALASVERAQADLKEKIAGLTIARVDEDLKRAQIDVAQIDRERSQALASYTHIAAPFAGVVVRRNVDPGDLVQNATTGASEPLFVLARTDVVKVVAKVPDHAAPFINRGTPVEIEIDQLPGVLLKAKVTRAAPSIDSVDRTMRIEVDLINGPGACPEDLSSEARASCDANAVGQALGGRKLLPGMNGYVRVRLNDFGDAYLVPSSAVFTRGGKQYAMLVEDGKVRKVPAVVQIDDGKTAKIALVRKDGSGREVLAELTGREEIIANRQSELDNGQAVVSNFKDW